MSSLSVGTPTKTPPTDDMVTPTAPPLQPQIYPHQPHAYVNYQSPPIGWYPDYYSSPPGGPGQYSSGPGYPLPPGGLGQYSSGPGYLPPPGGPGQYSSGPGYPLSPFPPPGGYYSTPSPVSYPPQPPPPYSDIYPQGTYKKFPLNFNFLNYRPVTTTTSSAHSHKSFTTHS